MRTWRASLLLLSLPAGSAFGCDDAGRRPAQAHVPSSSLAPNPAATRFSAASAQPQNPQQMISLPLWSREAQLPISLLPAIPNGRTLLVAKVQEKFASGEQNF